jgi:hypothetical protein
MAKGILSGMEGALGLSAWRCKLPTIQPYKITRLYDIYQGSSI